jgi:transcriptional regulator
MQSQFHFKTVVEIFDFLENMSHDENAMIEVVRQCYFSYREKRAFDHYPAWLNGKRQSDIGFSLGYTQGTVSMLLKRCKYKLQFFKEWFSFPVRDNLQVIQSVCTRREYDALLYTLSGKKMVEISKLFKCTKFNISLLCSHALRRLKGASPTVYDWAYSMLTLLKTIKS